MYHFKNSSRHINRYLKNGVSNSIVHEIKHVDFQLYRAHPERVIWNKLTADDEHINKGIRTFIHQTMSLSGVEKEKLLERNWGSHLCEMTVSITFKKFVRETEKNQVTEAFYFCMKKNRIF